MIKQADVSESKSPIADDNLGHDIHATEFKQWTQYKSNKTSKQLDVKNAELVCLVCKSRWRWRLVTWDNIVELALMLDMHPSTHVFTRLMSLFIKDATLIIGHTPCTVLSILHILTLQKKLQNFKAQQHQNKKSTIKKTLPVPGIEPGSSHTQSGCVTSALLSQMRVAIVVRLFNCFDAMSRNLNKQSRICGHTFSTNSFLLWYFTCMDNYIWQIVWYLV